MITLSTVSDSRAARNQGEFIGVLTIVTVVSFAVATRHFRIYTDSIYRCTYQHQWQQYGFFHLIKV